jgi:hypothetical protein
VELLIIGFQVCVWLFLIVSSTIGVNSIDFMADKFAKYPALATPLVFALAYVLGIFSDKLAKWLTEVSCLEFCLRSLKKRFTEADENGSSDLSQKRYAYIMVRKGQPMADLSYARSKVRILRASMVNIPLITIAAILYMGTHLTIATEWKIVSLGVAALDGLILTVLFAWAYAYNEFLHQKRLQLFYEAAEAEEKSKRQSMQDER